MTYYLNDLYSHPLIPIKKESIMNIIKHFILLALSFIGLISCTDKPQKIEPVTEFNINKYLGKWYEIARLDHSFERGMNSVNATYSLNEDGSVRVLNQGWNEKDEEWTHATGKAKFVYTPDIAHLKVSFFGPFYSSYIVFYLEPNYSSALVSGYNTDYFWILSRTPTLPKEVIDKYIKIAKNSGYDTSTLLFPKQLHSH